MRFSRSIEKALIVLIIQLRRFIRWTTTLWPALVSTRTSSISNSATVRVNLQKLTHARTSADAFRLLSRVVMRCDSMDDASTLSDSYSSTIRFAHRRMAKERSSGSENRDGTLMKRPADGTVIMITSVKAIRFSAGLMI